MYTIKVHKKLVFMLDHRSEDNKINQNSVFKHKGLQSKLHKYIIIIINRKILSIKRNLY